MKALTIGELKAHFSEVITSVQNGEQVEILFGKSKKPVAMLVPILYKNEKRTLGMLKGKAQFKFKGDGKIDIDEFLGI